MNNLVRNPQFEPAAAQAGGPLTTQGHYPEFLHGWLTRHKPSGPRMRGAQTVAEWWWTHLSDANDTIQTELIPSSSGASTTGNTMRVSLSSRDGGITTTFPVPSGVKKLTANVWVSLIAGEIVLDVGDPDKMNQENRIDYKMLQGWKQITLTNDVSSSPGNDGQILLYSTGPTETIFYVCAPEVIGAN